MMIISTPTFHTNKLEFDVGKRTISDNNREANSGAQV